MKKELIFNTDLHFEHENWNRELLFWEDELISFQNRLDELVLRWTAREVLTEVEKFQNHIIVHREAIVSIKNQIELHETNMADHYKRDEDVLNKDLVSKHELLRYKIEIQRNLFNEFKGNFFRFLTKYL
ncbi:hypothetical protein [Lutimonas zeaxanthinifaciens]|uniref:hypothetical protein n=1 Tax=Lutimonas zeaxanthinifaciens TaxID=3060215 RepID=UPI00265CD408|nr:hypothetical protein [Lutimonas sp. YSD2104]WKK65684.1 hypothetical protein QZH61_13975 [Lutimonas sp. YSD2104]